MLPVNTMSRPSCSLSALTWAIQSPVRTVEFCHCGSVMVEETTYFWTWLSSSVTPLWSSVCCGQ